VQVHSGGGGEKGQDLVEIKKNHLAFHQPLKNLAAICMFMGGEQEKFTALSVRSFFCCMIYQFFALSSNVERNRGRESEFNCMVHTTDEFGLSR